MIDPRPEAVPSHALPHALPNAPPHASADPPETGAPPLDAGLRDWARQATARLQVAATPLAPVQRERGRVRACADGIAEVSGLDGCRLNELLHLGDGLYGYAASLEPTHIACVLLDDPQRVHVGLTVERSGDVVRVPVGPALLGRVVDPLGRPLDGGPPIDARTWREAEAPAPAILDRAPVREPVHTGTLVVDALFPVGRGQRELIIGDRGTGKTALAVDALLAQRDSGLVNVYVAVGQKSEDTAAVVEALRAGGVLAHSTVVVARGSDAPGLQWLAPLAGMAMAEHWRDQGAHALIVIDDLSQHAATHRELALLMRRPPGREAYPGDVFHLHARLLERAARLSAARGGGSLTALPIARTEAGNLAAYIPTNLISITDGQIVLDSRQFDLGQLPAVDTGLSVSRVGGKTQHPLLRAAAGSLRLDYAQFLELEAFTRFGTELEASVRERIARGRRIRAVLAQDRGAPQSLALQLALLIALQHGQLDTLPERPAAATLATLRHALDQALDPALMQDTALGAALQDSAAPNGPADLQAWAERLRPSVARALAAALAVEGGTAGARPIPTR